MATKNIFNGNIYYTSSVEKDFLYKDIGAHN